MALLSFDQFEAAVPELLAEAPGARGDLHPVGRFGEEGPLKPLGAAIAAAARLVPHIDRPLEPGAHYISPDGEPPRRWDVRAEALAVLAQILEASAAIRSTMSAESARLRGDAGAGAIAEEAFLSFAAPGGGLPVEILEWSLAVEQLGGALAFLQNSRVGPEIGPAGAHDALDRAAAHVVCVLARSTRSARRRRGEQRGALVKLAACGPGDLVLVCKGGRRSYAKMHEISDGLVCVEAIQRGVTWRHATAHEIIDHWRHARRRHSGEASVAVEGPPPLPPPAQLSFAGRLERPGAEGG